MSKVLESEIRIRETGKGTRHSDPKPRGASTTIFGNETRKP